MRKFDRQFHTNFQSYQAKNKFFKNKESRQSFFWYLVGDFAAYFVVFYFIGFILGAGIMIYVLVWPLLSIFIKPIISAFTGC